MGRAHPSLLFNISMTMLRLHCDDFWSSRQNHDVRFIYAGVLSYDDVSARSTIVVKTDLPVDDNSTRAEHNDISVGG